MEVLVSAPLLAVGSFGGLLPVTIRSSIAVAIRSALVTGSLLTPLSELRQLIHFGAIPQAVNTSALARLAVGSAVVVLVVVAVVGVLQFESILEQQPKAAGPLPVQVTVVHRVVQ